jgi:acyl-CoA dehydrogenase
MAYPELPPSAHYGDEHAALRATVRRFVDAELAPHVAAWEEAKTFPRALYRRAGELGLLGVGFPAEYGGTPADPFASLVVIDELARTGSGGLLASLFSHTIAAPPIVAGGGDALKARVLPGILSGATIAALAITEPSGGSDVASLRTRAVRDGDHYVVTGEKTFITSGLRADWLTVAVRTGGPGAGGVSLLLVDGATPGLARTPLDKMGWWCSDTATLRFDGVRVPAEHLLGAENAGFPLVMRNFNNERLNLAAQSLGFARVCLDEASDWALARTAFGKRLVEHQVIRHKLVAMATRVEATRALLEELAARVARGEQPVAQLCMLKNFAAQTVKFCADEAVQILGGLGYVRGSKSERVYRDAKIYQIGGGTDEVLTDLAARQLGWT